LKSLKIDFKLILLEKVFCVKATRATPSLRYHKKVCVRGL